MAGNQNSGRNVYFPMTEKELEKAIAEYKESALAGEFARPSWPHFCASLDSTEKDLAGVMAKAGDVKSGYNERARMLNKMATWMRGQYCSSSAWSGAANGKACFALKQDVGDGVSWSDKDTGNTGPVEVKVSFGGDDARGRKAGK